MMIIESFTVFILGFLYLYDLHYTILHQENFRYVMHKFPIEKICLEFMEKEIFAILPFNKQSQNIIHC